MRTRRRWEDETEAGCAGGGPEGEGLAGTVREANRFLDAADGAIDRLIDRDVVGFMAQRRQISGQ